MKTIKLSGLALAIALNIGLLVSCSNNDSATPLPPIGGYNSADEVAAADLVAYWPLNGNGKESKSNTAPTTTVGTTFVAGAKGQCASLNSGYLDYPSIASLTTMTGSFTVSLWAKVANNGTNATMFFSMTKPVNADTNEWNGGINVMAETGIGSRLITSDTLKVKGLFNFLKPDGTGFGGDAVNAEELNEGDIASGGVVHVNKTANQWMQVVYVYDGTTSINRLYVNGTKISNPQWEERNKIDGTNVGIPFKLEAGSHPLIGAFGTNVKGVPDGWQKAMKGEVDEIRLWKKALNAADINSLYELEKAGR